MQEFQKSLRIFKSFRGFVSDMELSTDHKVLRMKCVKHPLAMVQVCVKMINLLLTHTVVALLFCSSFLRVLFVAKFY